jgi:hypothetical protein
VQGIGISLRTSKSRQVVIWRIQGDLSRLCLITASSSSPDTSHPINLKLSIRLALAAQITSYANSSIIRPREMHVSVQSSFNMNAIA